MLDAKELARYLTKVDRTFGIDRLLALSADPEAVVRYYVESEAGYALFHSPHGSVHMTLARPGSHGKPDNLGQARVIQQQAEVIDARTLIELGSGKGFNVAYIAAQRPGANVIGMDLTPLYVSIAKEKYARLTNLSFLVGDFHALPFGCRKCDLLFEVEALCHAQDAERAFRDAYMVLRNGGRFVLFDGFRAEGLASYPEDVRIAVSLVERTMAVKQFPTVDSWLSLARAAGFRVCATQDLSEAILPNLERFQYLARGFYKFPALSAALRRICRPALLKNSVAGLLMPFTIQAGAHLYYSVVLEKP